MTLRLTIRPILSQLVLPILLHVSIGGCVAQQADLKRTESKLDRKIARLNHNGKELEEKITQAETRIGQLRKEAEQLTTEARSSLQQDIIDLRNAYLQTINGKLNEVDESLNRNSKGLDTLQQRINSLTQLLEEQAKKETRLSEDLKLIAQRIEKIESSPGITVSPQLSERPNPEQTKELASDKAKITTLRESRSEVASKGAVAYEILSVSDISVKALGPKRLSDYTPRGLAALPTNKRVRYRILVSPHIRESQVKPTIEKIIADVTSADNDVDAIILLLYSDNQLAGGAYDVATAIWAPSGKLGNVTPHIARTNERTGYRVSLQIRQNLEQYLAEQDGYLQQP